MMNDLVPIPNFRTEKELLFVLSWEPHPKFSEVIKTIKIKKVKEFDQIVNRFKPRGTKQRWLVSDLIHDHVGRFVKHGNLRVETKHKYMLFRSVIIKESFLNYTKSIKWTWKDDEKKLTDENLKVLEELFNMSPSNEEEIDKYLTEWARRLMREPIDRIKSEKGKKKR